MARYRKIYTDIEAMVWNGLNYEELKEFIHGDGQNLSVYWESIRVQRGFYALDSLNMNTINGWRMVEPGDYIVKTPTGCCYPLKKEHFEKAYALVE